jgi:hypothetical protein
MVGSAMPLLDHARIRGSSDQVIQVQPLTEFIRKVAAWYYAHYGELPDPDGVVEDLSVYDKRTALYEYDDP